MTSSDELARLRAENAALNEQLKLLVRTEQRLYRSQNQRDHELRRIRAIGKFGIDVVGIPLEHLLKRVIELLHQCFSLEHAIAVERSTEGRLVVVGSTTAVELTPAVRQLLEHRQILEVGPGGATVVRELTAVFGIEVEAGWCTVIPTNAGVILATSSSRPRPVYRNEPIRPEHLPIVDLIGDHVQRVIAMARLTQDLEQRSASLVEVNARLAESLATLGRTQDQLIQAGKMEAIGRLAGGVAHDFNNLLTIILNHSSFVREGVPPNTEIADDIERVIETAMRAAEITSQLLALGRKTVQRRESLDLGTVTHELGRVLRGLIGGKVKIEVSCEERCFVSADRSQLEQILLNLVINARDAMELDGVVRISVRTATDADLAQLAGEARPLVILEVADNGIGMDDATRERIFEPFFTTKSNGQGTGLGLAVVYGVVAQNEGRIAVESRVGVGTRFLIGLPRHTPATARIEPKPEPSRAGARVLIVEDDPAIRRIASRILVRAGYQVEEACDGVEALARLELAAIELVITDLNMPRMGGLELARCLELRTTRPRVLFMTGYSSELAEVSKQAPNVACMTKPFTPHQLLTHVGEQLRERA